MGRSSVCWKSSDSDVEDDSGKQKTPNGEPPSVKGIKKPQRLSKEDELKKRVIDLDLHMSKALKDMLNKLDHLDVINLEIINKFVGMLDVDRNNKVVRLVGECEDGRKEPKHKKVQQVSVNPGLVRVEPRISEIQPVDESVDVNTLTKLSLRDVGTITDGTHVSVVSTCSGPDAPFSREIYVTPVEMKSIACETEYLVESRDLSNPVLIDNGVKVMETKSSQTEVKSIERVNTEEDVESNKTVKSLSGHFNPTKEWNMTPFDVYCKRVSVPEPEPVRDGESPFRSLIARPASKSKLSKIPRAFSNVNITHTVEEKAATDIATNSQGGSLIEKGGNDTPVVDVNGVAPHMFGYKPTSFGFNARLK